MISLNKSVYLIILIYFFTFLNYEALAYEIPTPKFQLYQTKNGFRVIIPDENGITLFAFHGSVNHKLKNNEPGDLYHVIRKKNNQEWIYENNDIKLSKSDILYYWIYIQHNSIGYELLNKNIAASNFEILNDINNNPMHDEAVRISDGQTDCLLSKTIVKGKHVCQGNLIFYETFDNLNLTKWQHEIYVPNDLNDADFVMFQKRPENLYIQNGKLNIVPRLFEEISGCSTTKIRSGLLNLGNECTGTNIEKECKRQAENFRIIPPIVSAKIRTKNSFSFRYGKIEVRAKLPKGDWLFPQILLEPLENFYGSSGFSSGQMRIAFIVGNEILYNSDNEQINGNRLSGGIIVSNDENYRSTWLKNTFWKQHFGDDYHVYSLTWTDESITLKVDDQFRYGTIEGGFSSNVYLKNLKSAKKWKLGESMAPFDREFYISLGVSAGGIGDFPDDCRNGINSNKKPWLNRDPKGEFNFWLNRNDWGKTWNCTESRMIVDYVKVYAL